MPPKELSLIRPPMSYTVKTMIHTTVYWQHQMFVIPPSPLPPRQIYRARSCESINPGRKNKFCNISQTVSVYCITITSCTYQAVFYLDQKSCPTVRRRQLIKLVADYRTVRMYIRYGSNTNTELPFHLISIITNSNNLQNFICSKPSCESKLSANWNITAKWIFPENTF